MGREKCLYRTPFGVRCVDALNQEVVYEGLRLEALPTDRPGRRVAGVGTPSGNFGFTDLGLFLESPERNWESDPTVRFQAEKREFVVLCQETQGRFHSCGLVIALNDAQVATLKTLPLFSAPTRPPVPGANLVRGQLKQKQGGEWVAAPFVWIEARYQKSPGSLPSHAIADERGVFALFLPAPSPKQFDTPATTPYARVRATAELTFHFEPPVQRYFCLSPEQRLESWSGNSAELAARRGAGWSCLPVQASLLTQKSVLTKTVSVALVGETTLRITDNADPKDSSVWLP